MNRPRLTYANLAATAALVIAIANSPVAVSAHSAVVAFAKRSGFATNAGKVGGLSVSSTPSPYRLLPLDATGHLPAAALPTTAPQFLGATATAVNANQLGSVVASGYATLGGANAVAKTATFFNLAHAGPDGSCGPSSQLPMLGQIVLFGGNFAPQGWDFADGQTLPVLGNTALFSVIGTQYGGNGTTNFQLPNLDGLGPAGTNYIIDVVSANAPSNFPARC